MDLNTQETLLTTGMGATFLLGVVLILVPEPLTTGIGIVLVSLSALLFVVDAMELLVESEREERE